MLTGRPIGTEGCFTGLSPESTAVITRFVHIIRTKYATPSKARQKQLRTNCTRTNPYNPQLINLTPEDQTDTVVIYLDYLTTGHTHFGYKVQYSTLLGYMDCMAAWIETHTGRDIRLEATTIVAQHLWKQHPMLDTIYADTKH